MIKSASDIWKEISVVNNLKWEFKLSNDVPILIAKDYFKFPSQVREFLDTFQWWSNDLTESIRPGKSCLIHPEVKDWFSVPFTRSINPLFGLENSNMRQVYGNCFNGNMPLVNVHSAFPHIDLEREQESKPKIYGDNHIAFNINLTEESYPVSTGFWSFNGKKSYLDFSWNDGVEEENFHAGVDKSISDRTTWFQIKDYGPWVLEETVDMVYNSLVAYPTYFFHSPYIEPEWFNDIDRVTLAGFLNTSPEDLNFQQKDIDSVSYAWEFFNLDKIHNYHPKRTKPL